MKIATILLIITLTSCAVIKIPVPTNGSKSDGVVNLAYEYDKFEKPQIDWGRAAVTAKNICLRWGYKSAAAFGGTASQCIRQSYRYGCTRIQVNIKYQCTN